MQLRGSIVNSMVKTAEAAQSDLGSSSVLLLNSYVTLRKPLNVSTLMFSLVKHEK